MLLNSPGDWLKEDCVTPLRGEGGLVSISSMSFLGVRCSRTNRAAYVGSISALAKPGRINEVFYTYLQIIFLSTSIFNQIKMCKNQTFKQCTYTIIQQPSINLTCKG